MRVAQKLTVLALGGCALLLAVGFLWFFDAAPASGPVATAPTSEVAAPDRCDHVVGVRDGAALSNAFDVKIATGADLCLVSAGGVEIVYTTVSGRPGDRMFALTGALTDAELASLGLVPAT